MTRRTPSRWRALLPLLLLLGAAPAQAQEASPTRTEQDREAERAREADMFGEEPAATDEERAPSTKSTKTSKSSEKADGEVAPKTDTARREADMFGEPDDGGDADPTPTATTEGLDSLDRKIDEADERLAIGGFAFLRMSYRLMEETGVRDQPLSAPNLVDLYLDARPNPRVRAFVRGRVLYDYTVQDTATTATGLTGDAPSSSMSLLGGARQTTQVQLDQLWLKFDIMRKVFVTVGRQRVRWGSARFWNPTDFLNATQINPLALFDQRLGVDLLRVHVPIESLGWNLYAVGILNGADSIDDVGGALRLEMLVKKTEVSASFAARKQRVTGPQAIPLVYTPAEEWPQTSTPLRFGLDVSSALWDLDVRAEVAVTNGLAQPFFRGAFALDGDNFAQSSFPEDYSRRDDWIVQAVVGFEWLWKYNDQDILAVTGEYFYNDMGYASDDLYLWLALQGGFRPLYLGRHYAALGVALPSPGSWDDSSFTLSGIGNLSDRSFLARFDYGLTFLTDLRFNAYAMVFAGEYGEFRFRAELPPLPVDERLESGLVIPAPRAEIGLGMRLSF